MFTTWNWELRPDGLPENHQIQTSPPIWPPGWTSAKLDWFPLHTLRYSNMAGKSHNKCFIMETSSRNWWFSSKFWPEGTLPTLRGASTLDCRVTNWVAHCGFHCLVFSAVGWNSSVPQEFDAVQRCAKDRVCLSIKLEWLESMCPLTSRKFRLGSKHHSACKVPH